MDEETALIAELTELALTRAAPDELVLFEETAEEYFADPQAALAARSGDTAVGFGLELAMITPAALAVGQTLVQALGSMLSERALASGGRGAVGLLRRLLRNAPGRLDASGAGNAPGRLDASGAGNAPGRLDASGAGNAPGRPDAGGAGKGPPDPQLALTREQALYLHQVALQRAHALGMPPQQASLLADSFVGALVTAG